MLQKWLRELRPSPRAKNGSSATKPIAPLQDVVESGVVPSAFSQHEIPYNPEVQDQSATNLKPAEKESEQSEHAAGDDAGDDQSIVPHEDADKSARRIADERKFERARDHWNKYLVPDWMDLSTEMRARFVSEVLGYPERVG